MTSLQISNTSSDVNKPLKNQDSKKFDIEVEEWDESVIKLRRQKMQSSSNDDTLRAKILSQKKLEQQQQPSASQNNAAQQQMPSLQNNQSPNKLTQKTIVAAKPLPLTMTSHNVTFCHEVNVEENLCHTDRYNLSHTDHTRVSALTMNFKSVGDIYVYSVFLDTRGKQSYVRLMVLAEKGRGGSMSIYWCVYSRDSNSRTRGFKSPSVRSDGSVFSLKNNASYVTQLEYYAAGDGHNMKHQFYIMSCPLPNGTEEVIPREERLFIHLVVGSTKSAMLGTVQEGVVVQVNKDSKESRRTRHKRAIYQSHINVFDFSKDNNVEPPGGNINSSLMYSNSKYGSINVRDSVGKKLPVIDESIVSCVAPLQTGVTVIRLIEFIELTLLLGSRHLVFYTFQSSEDINNVLDMYRKQGLVTVMPWVLPDADNVWAHARDVALNDCLYRVMPHFDWALFHDTDEFFVPRATPDLPSFLNYLRKTGGLNRNKHSDIVFSSAYFPPPTKAQYLDITKAPGFTRDVSKFATLKTVHRSYINQKHTLRMLNVSRALRVGAGERKKTAYVISTPLGAVSHYSYCPAGTVTVHKPVKQTDDDDSPPQSQATGSLCEHTKVDWVMWRYKRILIENVKNSVKTLNTMFYPHRSHPHQGG